VIGDEIGTAMVGVLNRPATTLILAAIALFGVTLFSGLSWIWVVDTVGLTALKVVRFFLLGTRGVIRALSSALGRLRVPRRKVLDQPRKAEKQSRNPLDQ